MLGMHGVLAAVDSACRALRRVGSGRRCSVLVSRRSRLSVPFHSSPFSRFLMSPDGRRLLTLLMCGQRFPFPSSLSQARDLWRRRMVNVFAALNAL